jgi:molybdate transport system permease protein
LDTEVRDELRRELRRVQRDTKVATVLVTHDPEEAALLADEVLVISDGELLQTGPQPEVFAHPAGPRAARLLGIRNLHTGRAHDVQTLDIGGELIEAGPLDVPPGTPVDWCIRPELVRLRTLAAADEGVAATVVDAVHLGAVTELLVRLDHGGHELAVISQDDLPLGTRCRVRLPAEHLIVWPATAALPRTRLHVRG